MDEPTRLHDFADGLFVRGVYDIAAKEYERLIERFPNYRKVDEVRFRLAESLFMLDKYSEAVVHFEKVVTSPPSPEYKTAAIFRLGTCQFHLKNYSEAKRVLTQLESEQVDGFYRYGAMYYLGKVAQAESDLKTAKSKYEEASKGGNYAALSAHARAEIAVQESDFTTAVKYFEIVLKIGTDQNVYYHSALALADVFKKLNEISRAEAVLRPLMDVESDFPSFDAAIRLSVLQFEAGKYSATLDVLREKIGKYPTSRQIPQAHLVCGASSRALKQWKDAEKHYTAAMTFKLTKTDALEAEVGYLASLFEQKLYGKVLEYAGLIDQDPPERFESWLFVAQSMQAVSQQKAALALYNRLEPAGPEPQLELARALRALLLEELNQREELVKTAARFHASYPKSATTPAILIKGGDAAIEIKDYASAILLFDYAEKCDAIDKLPDLKYYLLYRRGIARHFAGDKSGMERDLRSSLESSHVKNMLDKILMLLGDYEQEREDYAKASAYFVRLIDEVPKSEMVVDARTRLGSCYYARKMNDKAAETYLSLMRDGHVVKLSPDIILWCVQYFAESKRYEDALFICNIGSEKLEDPAVIAEMNFKFAEVLEQSGDHANAVKRYRKFITDNEKSPRRYSARLGLARCLRKTGDVDEARRLLHDLIRDTVATVKSTCTLELAELEYEQSNFDAALREYLMVAILETDETLAAPALIGAIRSCAKLSRKEDAIKYAKELIQRFPNSNYRKEAEGFLAPQAP